MVPQGRSQQIYSGQAIAAYGQLAGHRGWVREGDVAEALEITLVAIYLFGAHACMVS